MVSGSFKLTEDTGHFQTQTDGFRVFGGISRQPVQGLLVDLVKRFVFVEDGFRQPDVLPLQGFISGVQHGEHCVVHIFQLKVGKQDFVFRFQFGPDHKAGNTFGIIADAFQIVVDLQHSQGKTEIDGYRIIEGDEVLDVTVDFQFESIDAFFT